MSHSYISNFPNLLKEWHPNLNTLSPDKVSHGSSRLVWWLCNKGHEWQTRAFSRTRNKLQGCPVCSGQRIVVGYNDLMTVAPNLAAQWHPTLNDDLLPAQVTRFSNKKVWWVCDSGHKWQGTVCGRNSRNGLASSCPTCGNRKILTGFNDLSFISPPLAAEWHPTKNGALKPENIGAGSTIKVWWKCAANHEFRGVIANRYRKKSLCPICVGYYPEGDKMLEAKLLKEWHMLKNFPRLPEDVTKGSDIKVWWVCELGHEWVASVGSRAGKLNRGCAVCSGNQVLAGFNDLAFLYPELSKQWHPTKNGSWLSSEVTSGSGKKAWWVCDRGHEWCAAVHSRSKNGSGCLSCVAPTWVSGPEREIGSFLSSNSIDFLVSDHTVLGKRELDIYLPSYNLAIEFNGLYWHSESAGKKKDYHFNKWQDCLSKGIDLLQVWEDDWSSKPELVKRMILEGLGMSQENPILDDSSEIVSLSVLESKTFFESYHLQGFISGGHYLGIRNLNSQALTNAIILDHASTPSSQFVIKRYAAAGFRLSGFNRLVTAASLSLGVTKFSGYSDNASSEKKLYESAGFTSLGAFAPNYMYVDKSVRVPVTKKELLLSRIWDSGKTGWVKVF